MKYTDKEVGSYTVGGEEREVVERTFTDGTVHHFFTREVECPHCSGGEVEVDCGSYNSASTERDLRSVTCPECDGRFSEFNEEVPCDPFGNDEDSDLYLPYVNARTETAMLDLIHRIDPNDFAMDSFG